MTQGVLKMVSRIWGQAANYEALWLAYRPDLGITMINTHSGQLWVSRCQVCPVREHEMGALMNSVEGVGTVVLDAGASLCKADSSSEVGMLCLESLVSLSLTAS